MIITKKQQAINFIKAGSFKKALTIMKTFKREFSKDEVRSIQIANECWNDQVRRNFYTMIGVDFVSHINRSRIIMTNYAK